MGVTTTQTNKPFNPRGNDQSPLAFNRAKLFSGKALDFDGVNDTITGSSSSLPASGYTIAAWFNLDTLKASGVFTWGDEATSERRSLFVWDGGSGTYYLYSSTYGSNVRGNTPLSIGRWYFGAVTLTNEGEATIYLNGNQDAIGTNTLAAYTGTTYKIGDTGSSEAFDGEISGARVFNQVLTAAQVADLYNNPEKVVPTGVDNTALKLWLPMQEGAGTTAYDGSGNGNHGAVSGASWLHGIGAPVAQTAVIDWNKGTNLLPYSEEINESVWTKTNVTITADQTTAPDGQSTADEVLFLGNGLTQFIGRNATTTAGEDYTISVYAKYVDQQWLQFTSSTSQFPAYYANFDIQNGVTGTISGATGSISDAGNGWYRINVTMTAHSSGSNTAIFVLSAIDSGTATRGASLTATNKTAYVWGAQGEQADAIGPYVRTGATAQTSEVLLPQGLTTGRDITGVNLFENVRKQGALNLDGNSWAEVHDNESLDITDAVSVEMWIYWQDQSAESTILGKWLSGDNRAYALIATTTTGEIDFRQRVSSSTYQLGISTLSSGWNHVVATHDHSANERIGYINGVEVSTSSSQGVSNESDNDVTIGGSATAQYTNSIAQPRIYNRALTAEEVARNYNNAKSIYTNS